MQKARSNASEVGPVTNRNDLLNTMSVFSIPVVDDRLL